MCALQPSCEYVVETTSSIAYRVRSFGHENASNWSSTEFRQAFFPRSSISKQIFLLRKTKITFFKSAKHQCWDWDQGFALNSKNFKLTLGLFHSIPHHSLCRKNFYSVTPHSRPSPQFKNFAPKFKNFAQSLKISQKIVKIRSTNHNLKKFQFLFRLGELRYRGSGPFQCLVKNAFKASRLISKITPSAQC